MKQLIVFMTDFTYKEGAVCAMYGVVKSVDRDLDITDGTHEIPQYDTWSASYRIYQSYKFWPQGTVFVLVVDPGVGTPRKASVAKTTDGYYVVSPDNGSLTHLKCKVGIEEVREIDESINRLRGKDTEEVAIFHGRDLFSYCGARLASGVITYEQVGPSYPVKDIVEHEILEPTAKAGKVNGIIEIPDPNFGNSWTNIPLSMFKSVGFEYGDMLDVVIKNKDKVVFEEKLLFHQSFGFAKKGQAMIYNNELMNIAFAVNQGSFLENYNIGYGADWTVEFSKN